MSRELKYRNLIHMPDTGARYDTGIVEGALLDMRDILAAALPDALKPQRDALLKKLDGAMEVLAAIDAAFGREQRLFLIKRHEDQLAAMRAEHEEAEKRLAEQPK